MLGLGATAARARRLQRDTLLDTTDRRLLCAGTALRVRADGERAFLTFKGPVVPGVVKADGSNRNIHRAPSLPRFLAGNLLRIKAFPRH